MPARVVRTIDGLYEFRHDQMRGYLAALWAALRRLARSSHDPGQVRRLLALAAIYDGEPRSTAAEIGGAGLQTVRDWVLRFNDAGAAGPQPRLAEHHRVALRQIVEEGPIPAVHGVVRWRIIDLLQWLWEALSQELSRCAEHP